MAADLALLPEGRDSWAGWYAALRLAGDVEPLLRALDAAELELSGLRDRVEAWIAVMEPYPDLNGDLLRGLRVAVAAGGSP